MTLTNKIQNLFNDKPIRNNAWRKYSVTGLEFIDEVNNLKPNLVLDLGCGNNIYKGRINNLIGIDILNNNLQDIYCDIIDLPFKDNSVDVIMAFGSINFGDDILIDQQIQEAIRVLKPKGRFYFRSIPNHKHSVYYNWTLDKIIKKTEKLNLEFIVKPKIINKLTRTDPAHDVRTGFRSSERIFCVWRKS